MDPITHAALGAACSQVLLNKYDQRNAWIAGALGAMAPDLDIFIRSATDPMLMFLYHRHFTHSLLFIPLGGLLVGVGLFMFRRFRQKKCLTIIAAIIGYATHAILDACTSYGTLLFWPFSTERIAWDWIAIVDPFFTVPIILGLVSTLQFKNIKGVVSGLMAAGLFMLFSIYQHERAITEVQKFWGKQEITLQHVRAFPNIGTSRNLRSVGYTSKNWYIADVYVPLFQSSTAQGVGVFPVLDTAKLPRFALYSCQQMRDFKLFDWFTQGNIIASQPDPLILIDARYLVGIRPLIALWGIQFIPNHPHAEQVRMIPLGDL